MAWNTYTATYATASIVVPIMISILNVIACPNGSNALSNSHAIQIRSTDNGTIVASRYHDSKANSPRGYYLSIGY